MSASMFGYKAVFVLLPVGLSCVGLLVIYLMIMGIRRIKAGGTRAILMKEMLSRMRGARTPLLLGVAAGLAITLALIILAVGWSDLSGDSFNVSTRLAQLGQSVFAGITALVAVLVCLITPALTSGAIALEHEQHTLEFLLLTPLSEMGILTGKLLAALSFAAMLVLCSLPVTALAFFFGGVSLGQYFGTTLYLLAVVICFGAVSLYCSVRFRKVATATALAYTCCLGLLLAQPIMLLIRQSGEDTLRIIIVCVAVIAFVTLFVMGLLFVTSLFIKRQREQRFRVLKRAFFVLLLTLGLCFVLFLMQQGGEDTIMFGNPGYCFSQLLSSYYSNHSYYYSDPLLNSIVSALFLLGIAIFALRRAYVILREQRVQRPAGPRLKFRVTPW